MGRGEKKGKNKLQIPTLDKEKNVIIFTIKDKKMKSKILTWEQLEMMDQQETEDKE